MEVNQHGSQLVFEGYRNAMKLFQLVASQFIQGEETPAAEAAPTE